MQNINNEPYNNNPYNNRPLDKRSRDDIPPDNRQRYDRPPDKRSRDDRPYDVYEKKYMTDERKKKLEEMDINRENREKTKKIMRKYRYLRKEGVSQLKDELLYSELLMKNKGGLGELYIQEGESNINFIQKLKDKFSINEDLFATIDEKNIDSGMNTGYASMDKDVNQITKSNADTDTDNVLTSPEKPPIAFINTSFQTRMNSFKHTSKETNIDEKYHPISSALNISIQEFNMYRKEYEKGGYRIDTTLNRLTNEITILKDDTDLSEKIKTHIQNFSNTIKKKLEDVPSSNNIIFIPSEQNEMSLSAYILLNTLITEKSFWILLLTDNRDFLNYLINRIMYIIGEIDDVSFSSKWNSVKKEKKDRIFNLFADDNNITPENLILLLITAGSNGFIRYLMVAAIYLIFESDNKREGTFEGFLSEKEKNNSSRLYNIINLFREEVFSITTSMSTDPYKRLLEYAWNEYQKGQVNTHIKRKKKNKKKKKKKADTELKADAYNKKHYYESIEREKMKTDALEGKTQPGKKDASRAVLYNDHHYRMATDKTNTKTLDALQEERLLKAKIDKAVERNPDATELELIKIRRDEINDAGDKYNANKFTEEMKKKAN